MTPQPSSGGWRRGADRLAREMRWRTRAFSRFRSASSASAAASWSGSPAGNETRTSQPLPPHSHCARPPSMPKQYNLLPQRGHTGAPRWPGTLQRAQREDPKREQRSRHRTRSPTEAGLRRLVSAATASMRFDSVAFSGKRAEGGRPLLLRGRGCPAGGWSGATGVDVGIGLPSRCPYCLTLKPGELHALRHEARDRSRYCSRPVPPADVTVNRDSISPHWESTLR